MATKKIDPRSMRTGVAMEIPNVLLARIEAFTDRVVAEAPHKARSRHAAILRLIEEALDADEARLSPPPRLKRASGTR